MYVQYFTFKFIKSFRHFENYLCYSHNSPLKLECVRPYGGLIESRCARYLVTLVRVVLNPNWGDPWSVKPTCGSTTTTTTTTTHIMYPRKERLIYWTRFLLRSEEYMRYLVGPACFPFQKDQLWIWYCCPPAITPFCSLFVLTCFKLQC